MHNKRKRFGQNRANNVKKPKARALIGKPNQSNMSVAIQLKEASECLSSNGFPSAAQFIDVTKSEPIRMDLDVSMISPVAVAAPQAVDGPVPAPTPNPPPRRGRGRAPAQAPDPAPNPAPIEAPPVTPPPTTPERQAQINALYSAKTRRDLVFEAFASPSKATNFCLICSLTNALNSP